MSYWTREGCAQQLTSVCCHTAGEADFSWGETFKCHTGWLCIHRGPLPHTRRAAAAAAYTDYCSGWRRMHSRPMSHLNISPMKNPPHWLCGSTH